MMKKMNWQKIKFKCQECGEESWFECDLEKTVLEADSDWFVCDDCNQVEAED